MRFWVLGGLAAVAAVFLLANFTEAFFTWTSICRVCGAEQHAYKILWIPVHRVTPTILSAYLDSTGYAKNHSHKWLFAHGSGGSTLCALGTGRQLWRVTKEQNAVDFLAAVRAYGSQSDFDNYVNKLLDPQSQNILDPWYSFSLGTNPTRKAFDEWMINWTDSQALLRDKS